MIPPLSVPRAPDPYHAHSFQVHLSPPQFLPTVVSVTFSLGYTTEVPREFEHIFYKGAATHLICRHLGQKKCKDLTPPLEEGRTEIF